MLLVYIENLRMGKKMVKSKNRNVLIGLGAGLLLAVVPATAVQAEDGKGREVPHYDIREVGGLWDGTNYFLPNGERVEDAFFCDGFSTYYLMTDGTPMKDRLTYHPDGKHVIYFDQDGHEVFSDFVNVKKSIEGDQVDDFCYFDANGYLYVDVVTYDRSGSVLYYANPYGVMERGKWFQFSDTVMYPGENGLCPWEGAAGGYGYANEDGTLMRDTWTYDWEGRVCYMQGNGVARYPSAEEMANMVLRQKETEHFVFHCTSQDVGILDKLAESLEGCHDRVTSDLRKTPADKTNVYVYPDLDRYHNEIGRPDAPDWSVGEARNGSLYMVSPLNPGPAHNYDDMFVIAVHEYVHIVVEQYNRSQPGYLNEGIACYEAGQFENMKYYIPLDRANGTLPSLAEMEPSYESRILYTYGPAYVDFIVKDFGFDSVIALLEGQSQEEVFGMSKEALNEKWMEYLMSWGK